MSNRDISSLYFLNRYPQNSLGFLTFFIYLPFGVLLLLLRVLLGVQVFIFGFLLPDVPVVQKLVCKLFCASLGIVADVENSSKREDVQMYISNCITPIDHLVVYSYTGAAMPGKVVFNSLLSTALGFRSFGPSTSLNTFKKNISTAITDGVAVHLQPEGKQTNGKAVLKFKTWPFGLCNRVQPVCIQIHRPLLDIKVSAFDSSYWVDIVYYLFLPYTSYTLRFLPIVTKLNLSEEEFAQKVRQNLANGLKVELSEYSASDLKEWEKRIMENVLRRQREEAQRPVGSANPEVQRMARQVKEVLPNVPLSAICSDLMKTWSVDQTITNILEGHVTYVPEVPTVVATPPPVSTVAPTCAQRSAKQDPLCTAASSFGKSAHERTLSFQERKQQLIQAARQRYIEKHGLNIVGSS